MKKFFFVINFIVLIAGCGQAGRLYLPNASEPQDLSQHRSTHSPSNQP